jgi:hypothetical protein
MVIIDLLRSQTLVNLVRTKPLFVHTSYNIQRACNRKNTEASYN